jgi:hypothetical protein
MPYFLLAVYIFFLFSIRIETLPDQWTHRCLFSLQETRGYESSLHLFTCSSRFRRGANIYTQMGEMHLHIYTAEENDI